MILKIVQKTLLVLSLWPYTRDFYQESIQSLQKNWKLITVKKKFVSGNHCLYLYLPRTAKQKKLHTNYLEKLFNVDLTMRKLNVVRKIIKQSSSEI